MDEVRITDTGRGATVGERYWAVDEAAVVPAGSSGGGLQSALSLPAALRDPSQAHCRGSDGNDEAQTENRPSPREEASGALTHAPVKLPKAIEFYIPLSQFSDDLGCRFFRVI